MSLNVSLTPQLEQFVRAKVASGRYTSSSEVVREALRLLEHLDGVQEAKLSALRADIRDGRDEIARGEHADWDVEAIKREGRARLASP